MIKLIFLLLVGVAIAERHLAYENVHPGSNDDFVYDFRSIPTKSSTNDGASVCPCLSEEKISENALNGETRLALTGYGTCKLETNCGHSINDSGDCVLKKCVVDVNNCDMQTKHIDNTKGLGFSYNTCGYRTPNQKESLEGKTLRVMLVSEVPGWIGEYSNYCRGRIMDAPDGCTGLSTVVLSNLQRVGKFDVEFHQALPDQYWTMVIEFCRATEHPDYGKPGWNDHPYHQNAEKGTKHHYKSHLCLNQVWSICIYAAAIGYLDWCPHAAVRTTERLGWGSGIEYHTQVYNLYSRVSVNRDGFTDFLTILELFKADVYGFILVFIIVSGFLTRWTSGYYIGFNEYRPDERFKKYYYEFLDILWYGSGMFIDLLYPQVLPGTGTKMIIIIFELIQVIIFGIITAGLTNILLLHQTTQIKDLSELTGGKSMCFFSEVRKTGYEQTHPAEMHIPKKVHQSYEEAEDDPNCSVIESTAEEIASQKGKGVFCSFGFMKSDRIENNYSAVNQQIWEPLNDAWNTYKKEHYEHDYDRMLKVAISPPKCEVYKPQFIPTSITPFADVFLWTSIIAIGLLVFQNAYEYIYGPTRHKNIEMSAFMTTTRPNKTYMFKYYGEAGHCNSEIESSESNEYVSYHSSRHSSRNS